MSKYLSLKHNLTIGVLTALLVLAQACNTDQATNPELEVWSPQTFADSVAAAHGYANWPVIERLDFDFQVEVADTVRTDRQWTWFPQRDSVIAHSAEGSISFVRSNQLTDSETTADSRFINDSYWLLMPFYLVWSKDGYTSTVKRAQAAPLSEEPMTMLTIQYDQQGGYTPGDAYDLYIDEDYRLKEWTFRKGGQQEPSMSMSWEDYKELDGLLLPTNHSGSGPVRIFHEDVQATAGR